MAVPGMVCRSRYWLEGSAVTERIEGLERLWLDELRGPIHGRLQMLRGMCTDERPHVEIDTKLAEVDDLVHRLSCAIEFPACKPTAADLERGRQLAEEHGW